MLVGAGKRADTHRLDLLCASWHMAGWNAAAKAGKLQEWGVYERKFRGTQAPTVPQDWRARKAERQQQMDLLKKKQAQKTKPMRRPRGRS